MWIIPPGDALALDFAGFSSDRPLLQPPYYRVNRFVPLPDHSNLLGATSILGSLLAELVQGLVNPLGRDPIPRLVRG